MSKIVAGRWTSVLTDIDRSTEFSGDDVDRYSKLVDLGADFEKIVVVIPTITSGTVTLYTQRDGNVASVPVILNIFDDDATGHFAHATSSGTGDFAIVFHLGGIQYFRIYCGANQGADRTFWVRGC